MNSDSLNREVAEADARLTGLRRRAAAPERPQYLLPEALQEIQSTMEELRVAMEEMRQQNEALAEAQERIAAEQSRYQDLFEFGPEGYLVTDMYGVIREANRAAERLLGRTSRALKGKPLSSIVAEDSVRAYRQRLLDAGRIANSEEWEMPLRRQKSAIFQASLTIAVIRTPSGEPTGLRWLLRDITERKQIEEELRLLNVELEARVGERTAELEASLARERAARAAAESAQRRQQEQAALMETLLAAAPTGFAFLDPGGRYVHVNPTLADWNGLPVAAHLGRPVASVMPEHWPLVKQYFDRSLAGETIRDVEVSGESFPASAPARYFLTSYYPVSVDGRILGVGAVTRDVTEQRQSEITLRNDLTRERTIAGTLQRTLLKPVPDERFPALKVATFYEAALAEAQVGGDFFDAFALDDGRIALVVGDISGKGLDAAACTAEVKYALRPFLRMGLPPAEAIARLNDFVCDALRHGDWDRVLNVALSLAVVDPQTNEITCAVAGSEAPLILRSDGSSDEIAAHGLLIGIEAGWPYSQQTVSFGPDDIVVMATDGITEARRQGEFLGQDGLRRLADQHRSIESLHECGRAILEDVRAYAGGSLQDDACILLAARR